MARDPHIETLELLASEHWLGGSHSNGVSFGLKEKVLEAKEQLEKVSALAKEAETADVLRLTFIPKETQGHYASLVKTLKDLIYDTDIENFVSRFVAEGGVQPFEMEGLREQARKSLDAKYNDAEKAGIPTEGQTHFDLRKLDKNKNRPEPPEGVQAQINTDMDEIAAAWDRSTSPEMLKPSSEVMRLINSKPFPEVQKLQLAAIELWQLREVMIQELETLQREGEPVFGEFRQKVASALVNIAVDEFSSLLGQQSPSTKSTALTEHDLREVNVSRQGGNKYKLVLPKGGNEDPKKFQHRARRLEDKILGMLGIKIEGRAKTSTHQFSIRLEVKDNPELKALLDQESKKGRPR